MTGREIVRRTLAFEGPDRVARSYAEGDIMGAGYDVDTPATDWVEVEEGRWECFDEWGNTWGRVDPTSKGEVTKGVLDDLGAMDAYVFPDFSRPESYERAREAREANPDVWVNGGMPGFAFNIARKLRKLDQYLIDILADAGRIHALHDRIDAILESMIRNYAAIGLDGVMFCEDWGTQDRLLINPALWEEEFRPRYERLCGLAHELGLTVWMHSCGQIEAIVPSCIEAGIDVFQFDQPELHGIGVLAGHQEKAKVTFWCPVDIQTTLQTKDEALIRSRAREMLDKLWRGRGGFIAGYYGDNVSIGLDPEWQEIASGEFERRGVREQYTAGAR